MPAVLLDPPEAGPVALAALKAHLRLDHDADDAVLARLLDAATAHVESVTRRVLVAQTWRVTVERWPPLRRIVLPLAPVQSLLAVRVLDAHGLGQTLPVEGFILETHRTPPVLRPRDGLAFEAGSGWEFDLAAGYGPPERVPAPLREAVLRLAALWHEHRMAGAGVAAGPAAPAVDALLAPYRVLA